ncbi:hypothetical protein CTAYLR_007176 [Chrysophaeum taylorii]|uniref:Uncharacterized protein n=1 Tax=Chrysophaeum taylorii TaxID=2483200 RepID=A0AAD7XNZ7_9STRA|nr:hypothetical protein CTAYLR_007176 [Chrysophaeum taylorii]
MWRRIAGTIVAFVLVCCGWLATHDERHLSLRVLETTEARRMLESVDFGDEIRSVSSIVAGESTDSSIRWLDSNVTAFQCTLFNLAGFIQVVHQEPSENNTINTVFFSFDNDETLGYFRLDDFDPDLNPIVRDRGQPDRVNAAGMLFDTDVNESNYPIAAFLFDEVSEEDQLSDEVFLCRYDVYRLECFDFMLNRVGTGSTIPFVGFVHHFTYFYANGLGIADLGVSRPLFLVRELEQDSPAKDETPYYVQRTVNSAMRCADITGFDQDSCVKPDGERVPCVTTEEEEEEEEEEKDFFSGAANATAFLTCITNNGVGIVLVALDGELTPAAYLWVEGVDLAVSNDDENVVVYPPTTQMNDAGATRVIANRQPPLLQGNSLGAFGACFVLDPPDFNHSVFEGSRIFCASNKGFGIWEVELPLEIGYCNGLWHAIDNHPSTDVVPSCERFPPSCADCTYPGTKPVLSYTAPSQVTFRNDGLNCFKTSRTVSELDLVPPLATPPPTSLTRVGADPVVVGPRGTKTQFWLPLGLWVNVLSSPNNDDDDDDIQLFVRCVGKPASHSQWIDGIVVKDRGDIVFDATIFNDDLHRDADRLAFSSVKLDGHTPIFTLGAYRSTKGPTSVELAKHDYPILDRLGDAITVATSAFKIQLLTMPARKFKNDFEAAKWTHFDFKILSIKDRSRCFGFLCDLMFGTNTFDADLKASWLKKPPVLDTANYYIEPPEALAGRTSVVYN